MCIRDSNYIGSTANFRASKIQNVNLLIITAFKSQWLWYYSLSHSVHLPELVNPQVAHRFTNFVISKLTGHCLLFCVALETSSSDWCASVGVRRVFDDENYVYDYYTNINATHWTTEFSYVCQYHSKSLRGLSLPVYLSAVSNWVH